MYHLLSAPGGKDKDMYFNQVEFGKRIRELRRTGGLTQEALSEELNISTDQLRKIECGSRGEYSCQSGNHSDIIRILFQYYPDAKAAGIDTSR